MNLSTIVDRRRLRSLLTYFPFRLRAERAISRESHARIEGFSLIIPVSVFHPGYFLSSRILAQEIGRMDLTSTRVLDMGTGSGILALAAARKGASVLAVDINPEAVRAAAHNAAENDLNDRIVVKVSDLFDCVDQEQFDLVMWNPPFYPKEAVDLASAAWNAGDRYGTIERFAHDLPRHLKQNGQCILILSSDMDIALVDGLLSHAGLQGSVKSVHRRFLESFSILAFSKHHE
ncbi:MAG TPA: HemK2/MTQ2 family protein methyltransferase [Bacteroidota bacterium]|nr:HemK2/MTQ2 family protein methyltransferase [Bacteroidota bacterium]